MTCILAIDPGTTQSGWVSYDNGVLSDFGKWDNDELLWRIANDSGDYMAIEQIASYGMAVGAEVFETCVWSGRFIQHWLDTHPASPYPIRVLRKDVKMHLCQSTQAKDANIRQAIIDLYGPGKERAIGKKASPGPLYGVSGDVWAALGVAITAASTMSTESRRRADEH